MTIAGMGFEGHNKKTKRILVLSCFRLVFNHPILLASFLFFACLYRVSPLLFSLVVSASPVVICTAMLLGTLLTLGQSKGVTTNGGFRPGHQMPPPVRTRLFDVTNVASSVERDNNIAKIKFAEVRKDIIERDMGLVSPLSQGQYSSFSSSPTKIEKKPVQEVGIGAGGYQCSKLKPQPQSQDEGRLESGLSSTCKFEAEGLQPHYQKLQDEISDGDDDNNKPMEGSINNASKTDGRSLEAKRKANAQYNDSSDSDSDEGDALVADIISTVNENEIRPLLESEDNHRSSSPKGKIMLVKSNDSNVDSGDETYYRVEEVDDEDDSEEDDEENRGVEEDGIKSVVSWTEDDQDNVRDLSTSELERNERLEKLIARRGHRSRDQDASDQDEESSEEVDENDDDDEEEESPMIEKDGTKNVITWTEDDEKNLKDLGTLELERNQRLEHLLTKRKALRNFTMIPERNLIDLENFDLPFLVAPVSTTRANPFDVPINPNQHQQESVPVPGSAPSSIVKRQNPFDSPDHSPKEKYSFLADSSRYKFSTVDQHVEKENPNQQVGLGGGMGHGPQGKALGISSNISISSQHQNKASSIMVDSSRPEFMGINKIEKPRVGPTAFSQDVHEMNAKEALFRRHQSFSRGPNFSPAGEAFKQESLDANPKDAVFRRYQSFNTGQSFFGPPREDGIGLLLNPYFIPEQMAHQEEISHPIILERRPDEDAESSSSSSSSNDTETESTAVVIDEEEDANQKIKEADSQSQSSETESDRHLHQGRNVSEADIRMEGSKDMEIHPGPESQVEKDGDFDPSKDHKIDDSSHGEIELAAGQMIEAAEVEKDDISILSLEGESSSSTEEDEKSVNMEERRNSNHGDKSGDGIPTKTSSDEALGLGRPNKEDDHIHPESVYNHVDECGDSIPTKASVDDALGPGHIQKEDDHIHPEPVYDTSPSGIVKIIPFISDDLHPADEDGEHDSGDVAVVT